MITLDPPITKKTLYNLCLQDQIIAFTYDLARSSDKTSKYVVFKVLPVPGVNIEKVLSYHYIFPKKMENIETVMTVYIPRKIHIKLVMNEECCSVCQKHTYEKYKYCFNTECSINNVNKCHNYIELGEVLLPYEKLNFKESNIPCKLCSSCKTCKKMLNNKKCVRHKICKHKKDKHYYHILNKLVIGQKTLI